MQIRNGKAFFDASEMTSEIDSIVNASKCPRTACVTVIRDSELGYLNAGVYSGGVISIDPWLIVFGVKSWDAKTAFEDVQEFTVNLTAKGQVNDLYIFGNSIPHGISEIDVAGFTEFKLPGCDTPAVKELPVNLKCKVRKLIKLGHALRNIVVAEVTGLAINANLLDMTRAEVANTLPLHEAVLIHPYTHKYPPGGYAPGNLGPVLRGAGGTPSGHKFTPDENGKVYIYKEQFYTAPFNDVFVRAFFPRPNTFIMSNNEDGSTRARHLCGGLLMHSPPAVQVPLRKDEVTLENIRRTGVFTVAYPVVEVEKEFLALRDKKDGCLDGTGFSLEKNTGNGPVPGIKECPVNMECKVISINDIPDSDYVLILANKVGLYAEKDLADIAPVDGLVSYFPRMIYSVLDSGMTEQFASMAEFNPVLPLPTYGSRHSGLWFTGPEMWQSGYTSWLLELLLSGYIYEKEYYQIRKWMADFRYEGHFSPDPLRTECRNNLTEALRMMVRAHRDYDKWRAIHEFFDKFEYSGQPNTP